jgi:hypothetical protein
MKKVYLAQLKCPDNHCVLAAAREFETPEEAQVLGTLLMERFGVLVAAKQMNYECVLCHSMQLHVDIQPTVYRSLEEALPHLRAEEERQALTARMIRQSRN